MDSYKGLILSNPRSPNRVTDSLVHLLGDETGQDMIEYSLLIAFIALCAVALLSGVDSNNSHIWSTLNTQLLSAQTAAS